MSSKTETEHGYNIHEYDSGRNYLLTSKGRGMEEDASE